MVKLHRVTAAVAVLLSVLALSAATGWLALQSGMQRAEGELNDRLTVTLRSVESEIERFRYLPDVLGQDKRIVDLLSSGQDEALVARANRYLETVREMSGADELYVLDKSGLTLAASNWQEPGSFVGNNYGFRPYFREALSAGEGRYYAVGVTTGKPGYFLSARVDGAAGAIGVVVAKVDMAPLEQAWAKAGELTGLADEAGVIFLTGHLPWKYRPLHVLSEESLAGLLAERRYDGIDLAAMSPIASFSPSTGTSRAITAGLGTLLLGTTPVEPDRWQLFAALPADPITDEARLLAGLAALLGLLASFVGLFVWQRRQLTRLKLDQHAVLERRVAERTEALAREIEERKRTETELRETHESLLHAAKLAALGRMSAAIVHEVSQPLSALDNTLAAASLHAERAGADDAKRALRSGRDLLRRMQRTVKHLRTFSSRRDPAPPEPVDLATVVDAAIEIVEPRAREAVVRLHFAHPAEPAVALGDANRLEQVFINLLLNAIDATALAGNKDVWIDFGRKDTRQHLRIHDTGGGIPEDIRGRIGEPFFTTKTTGEGLGLGLSISRAILEELGARLVFETRAGGGTIALVDLPAASQTAPRLEPA